ncbi:hypothetical protein DPMN_097463 [Dreissena polymorpha]|uniref:Uncharacterized protein n=1 Tax=Dreissena polymorpha TaxID=45954 RepID=A0A9D4LAK6_DREPO|nr:hypothetical protein DPMN_097463 [Dreissena polymorpha]
MKDDKDRSIAYFLSSSRHNDGSSSLHGSLKTLDVLDRKWSPFSRAIETHVTGKLLSANVQAARYA